MNTNELETLSNAILIAFMVFVLGAIVCVLTGNLVAGLISFVVVMICAEMLLVLANEYEIVEYYDLDEEELD